MLRDFFQWATTRVTKAFSEFYLHGKEHFKKDVIWMTTSEGSVDLWLKIVSGINQKVASLMLNVECCTANYELIIQNA